MRSSASWPAIAAMALALVPLGVGRAEQAVEAAGSASSWASQQARALHVGDTRGPAPRGFTEGSQYAGNTDPDNEAINQAWQDAGQPSPFNPKTTPRLRHQVVKASSYQKARRAAENAISSSDTGTAAQSLWNAAGAVARETNGDIMEILHILMIESIKEDNEYKRMILRKLDRYNKIDQALSESLDQLADASRKLAARESKDESDAKERIDYWRYDTSTIGTDGEPLGTQHVSKNVTRAQLGIEMKLIENDMEEVRNLKRKALNEYQHMDQVVNQEIQAISRLMRALGTLRTEIGLEGQKY